MRKRFSEPGKIVRFLYTFTLHFLHFRALHTERHAEDPHIFTCAPNHTVVTYTLIVAVVNGAVKICEIYDRIFGSFEHVNDCTHS